MVSAMKRVHRNPKLNPGWEVEFKKGFFEEITLETQRLNNSQVWREVLARNHMCEGHWAERSLACFWRVKEAMR